MIPKDYNDLSVEFFSSILSIPVASFNRTDGNSGFSEIKQGNTSVVYGITVNFCNPLTFPPRRLFLKFALPLEDQGTRNVSFRRQTFLDAAVYRKEVAFYRHVRETWSSSSGFRELVPQVYYAEIEEPGGADHFLIVLGEAGEPLNQLIGCSMDTSRNVMRQVAHFHSLFMNYSSIPAGLEPCFAPLHRLLCQIIYGPAAHLDKTPEMLLDRCLGSFEEKFTDMCEVIEAAGGWNLEAQVKALKAQFQDKSIIDRVRLAFKLCVLEPSVRCLLHGDFRLDNMLLDSQTQTVKFIDFQALHYGHPAYDLAQFIVQCHDDPQVLEELVTIYYNTLMERLPQLNLQFKELFEAVKSAVVFQVLLLAFHLAPLKAAIDPETRKLPASMDPFMDLIQLITRRGFNALI